MNLRLSFMHVAAICLAAALLAPPAQTAAASPAADGLQPITPETVRGLRLLAAVGQGTLSGAFDLQPGGPLLAAVTANGVALLDRESGDQSGYLDLGFEPTALAIAPDGSRLAVVYNVPTGRLLADSKIGQGGPEYERRIALYSLPDGQPQGAGIADLGACAHSNIWRIAFTPDGRSLVFESKFGDAASDGRSRACRLDLAAGRVARVLDIPPQAESVLSPDGRFVAVAARDANDRADRAVVYETAAFSPITTISFNAVKWPAFDFTRRGDFVLLPSPAESGAAPRTVRFWTLPDGKDFLSLVEDEALPPASGGGYDAILSADISPDGRWAATGSQGGKVKLWDGKQGKLVKEVAALTWVSHNQIENPGGALSAPVSSYANPVAFSPDGKTLTAAEALTGFGQSGQIHVYRLPDGAEQAAFRGDGVGNDDAGLAFSPDGRRIAWGGFADGSARVFNVPDGSQALLLAGHTDRVNQAAFSPDGAWIATASDDRTLRLWDAAGGKSARELKGHTARVTRAAFSPDGQWLVSAADDNTLRRWRVSDGALLETHTLAEGTWRVEFLGVMPGGNALLYTARAYPSPLTGYVTRQALWDLAGGSEVEVGGGRVTVAWMGPDGRAFTGYGPDGRTVGVLDADGKMTLAADAIRSPFGNGSLTGMVLTPDRRLAVSGNGFGLQAWTMSATGAAFLDRVAAGQPVPAYGSAYEISPDGKVLAFAANGVVYLLGVPGAR